LQGHRLLVRIHCDLKFVSYVLEINLFLDNGFSMDMGWRVCLMDDEDTQWTKNTELYMVLMHISTVAVETQVEVLTDLTHESVSLDWLHLAIRARDPFMHILLQLHFTLQLSDLVLLVLQYPVLFLVLQ
jgi:hypothetical protein